MIDMQEWLLDSFEDESLTIGELRQALTHRGRARQIWVEYSDSEDYVDDCQDQIRIFLENMNDVI